MKSFAVSKNIAIIPSTRLRELPNLIEVMGKLDVRCSGIIKDIQERDDTFLLIHIDLGIVDAPSKTRFGKILTMENINYPYSKIVDGFAVLSVLPSSSSQGGKEELEIVNMCYLRTTQTWNVPLELAQMIEGLLPSYNKIYTTINLTDPDWKNTVTFFAEQNFGYPVVSVDEKTVSGVSLSSPFLVMIYDGKQHNPITTQSNAIEIVKRWMTTKKCSASSFIPDTLEKRLNEMIDSPSYYAGSFGVCDVSTTTGGIVYKLCIGVDDLEISERPIFSVKKPAYFIWSTRSSKNVSPTQIDWPSIPEIAIIVKEYQRGVIAKYIFTKGIGYILSLTVEAMRYITIASSKCISVLYDSILEHLKVLEHVKEGTYASKRDALKALYDAVNSITLNDVTDSKYTNDKTKKRLKGCLDDSILPQNFKLVIMHVFGLEGLEESFPITYSPISGPCDIPLYKGKIIDDSFVIPTILKSPLKVTTIEKESPISTTTKKKGAPKKIVITKAELTKPSYLKEILIAGTSGKKHVNAEYLKTGRECIDTQSKKKILRKISLARAKSEGYKGDDDRILSAFSKALGYTDYNDYIYTMTIIEETATLSGYTGVNDFAIAEGFADVFHYAYSVAKLRKMALSSGFNSTEDYAHSKGYGDVFEFVRDAHKAGTI